MQRMATQQFLLPQTLQDAWKQKESATKVAPWRYLCIATKQLDYWEWQ
jgi:hypothetical protein